MKMMFSVLVNFYHKYFRKNIVQRKGRGLDETQILSVQPIGSVALLHMQKANSIKTDNGSLHYGEMNKIEDTKTT